MTDPTADQLRAAAGYLSPLFQADASTKELEADPLYVVAQDLLQRANTLDARAGSEPAPSGWYVFTVGLSSVAGSRTDSSPEHFEDPTEDLLEECAMDWAGNYLEASWRRTDEDGNDLEGG